MARTRPYPFQKEDIWKIQKAFKGRAYLAHDVGCGKGVMALLWLKYYLKEGPTVIVCPASLKWNWSNEIEKHIKGTPYEVLGSRSHRELSVENKDKIFIINYDVLKNWVLQLRAIQPNLVIGDESHACKSQRAQRTKAMKSLCRDVPHVLFLSGTPIMNRPSELFPCLNILRPDRFPSFWSYGLEFCGGKLGDWGWSFDGATNLEKLNQLLTSTCLIRRRKIDVLKDLPPLTHTIVPIEIDDRPQYMEAEKEYVKWLRKHKPDKVTSALWAEKLTQFTHLRHLIGTLKLNPVERWVRDWLDGTDGGILVFGVHRDVLRPLRDRFKDQAIHVDGDVVGEERQNRFNTFNKRNGTPLRVFVGNMDAAGMGWSCTSASSVVFAELGVVPAKHTQAAGRVWGISRGEGGMPAQVYWLVAKGTLEEKLVRIIQKKQNIVSGTLDRGEVEMEVLSLLEKELLEDK